MKANLLYLLYKELNESKKARNFGFADQSFKNDARTVDVYSKTGTRHSRRKRNYE